MIENNDKIYVVTGANWCADVELTEKDINDSVHKDNIVIEAATRAIEAFFNKRNDIEIRRFDKDEFNYDADTGELIEKNELRQVIVDLLTDELIKDCGIGMLICVACTDNLNNESYISSKVIMQNAGISGKLIEAFDKKYPDDDIPNVKSVQKKKNSKKKKK